jgi:hypothetical protein
VSDATCHGCGDLLTGRRPQTKWCSGACRQRKLKRDRGPVSRFYICGVCGIDIVVVGRGGARTMCDPCSARWGQLNRVRPTERYGCRCCGEAFTRPPTKGQRPGWCETCRTEGVPVECLACGQRATVRKRAPQRKPARFCSNECWHAWQTRPIYGPPAPRYSTKLVHVGSWMRRRRPAAPTGPRHLWVAARCRRCDEPFIVAGQLTAAYCSRSCIRADAKDRRRAAVRAASGAELVYRKRIFERDGWRCQLCHKKVRRDVDWLHDLAPTLDHIVPVTEDGRHEPANVQCAHRICNSFKGARVHGSGEQLRLIG